MRKFISNLSTLRRSLLVSAAAFVVVATAVSATTISTSITTIGLTATGSATLGDAVADGVILNGRLSTGSAAGAALTLDSTYAYTEGAELRYTVTDWTGIGNNTFEGMYLRPQINTANASGNLKGIEVNTVNNGVALGSIHGGYFETQMKAISADTTVGPIYGIESQISQYAPTSGTLTLTEQSNVGAAAGRFQLGLAAGLADYTSIYGVLIQSNDASAASRTLGSGLLIRNYPAEGTQTWTKAIDVTAPAVTGISLSGAMTTGINISGTATTDISLHDTSTIKTGVISGTTLKSIVITPKSSVLTDSINYHTSLDFSGTFGVPAYRTYGFATGFTRDAVLATAAFDGVDTVLDVRAQNNVINDAAYDIQGAYIKAKNKGSTGGVVGLLRGLNVEAASEEGATTTDIVGQEIAVQNDSSTTVANALGLKFRKASGGTGYFTDIMLQNGAIIAGGAGTDDASITAQVDDAAVNGLYLATDGKVWILQAGTWTQLTVN